MTEPTFKQIGPTDIFREKATGRLLVGHLALVRRGDEVVGPRMFLSPIDGNVQDLQDAVNADDPIFLGEWLARASRSVGRREPVLLTPDEFEGRYQVAVPVAVDPS